MQASEEIKIENTDINQASQRSQKAEHKLIIDRESKERLSKARADLAVRASMSHAEISYPDIIRLILDLMENIGEEEIRDSMEEPEASILESIKNSIENYEPNEAPKCPDECPRCGEPIDGYWAGHISECSEL